MTTETWSARVDWADEYTEQLAATPQGSTAPDSDHRCKKRPPASTDPRHHSEGIVVSSRVDPKGRHTQRHRSSACLEHLCDSGLMSSKPVPCRTCQTPFSVPARSRPRDHYCSERCRPKCDYPACSTHQSSASAQDVGSIATTTFRSAASSDTQCVRSRSTREHHDNEHNHAD